jgi:hypothetical protein
MKKKQKYMSCTSINRDSKEARAYPAYVFQYILQDHLIVPYVWDTLILYREIKEDL